MLIIQMATNACDTNKSMKINIIPELDHLLNAEGRMRSVLLGDDSCQSHVLLGTVPSQGAVVVLMA